MKLSKYRGLIVLLVDMSLIFACNFVLFLPGLISHEFAFFNLILHIGFLTVCFLIMQIAFKTYESLWRYAESREYLLLLSGMVFGFIIYSVVNFLLKTDPIWIDRALTGTALALLAMLLVRFVYRMYRRRTTGGVSDTKKKNIAVIGAGMAGTSLAIELLNAPDARYSPYCFIDDDIEKKNKRINGIRVYGPIDDLEEILGDTPVTDIVLAIQNLSTERRAHILNLCAKTNCRLHVLEDPITQLHTRNINGRPGMRTVQIEDLLGRDPVKLNNQKVTGFIEGKTVLVTGGGGSIGSELCTQIAGYKPERLIILDIAENTTYDLQNELLHKYGRDFPLSVEIASVRDRKKMAMIFEMYHPQIVFHAAAHKHVPLMENCPEEAVKNNVFGTYNIALLARAYKAEKFVLISTDKAVNPTNIMGTTKNICEQILRCLKNTGETKFAAVRFGNVLGSNGSVIPLFQKQIAQGGPVTVTDKRIIRYFMTIPEAVQLVLEAGAMAENGEIYVLDMGEPVKIIDLAEKMIRLSGYQPYTEIKIEEIGLRPGEKLYEELLTDSADLSRTDNKKIYVEKMVDVDYDSMMTSLEKLADVAQKNDRKEVFEILHEMVPTFRSPDIVNKEAIEASKDGSIDVKQMA